MATSRKSPRIVPFPGRGRVTTLADVAKAQAQRVGRRIRERRDELELTQKQLAERMTASPGTDAQQVSNWERGIHRPSDDNLEIIAEALETDVADLVSGPLSERKPKGDTPDPFARNGNVATGDLREQLLALDGKLDQILGVQAKLERRLATAQADHKLLDRINRDVEAIRATIDADAQTGDEGKRRPEAS